MINNTMSRSEFLERLEQFKGLFDKAVGNRTYNRMYTLIGTSPVYMDSLLKGLNNNFPHPALLKKITDNSEDKEITHELLMRVCGHTKNEFQRPSDMMIRRGDILHVDLGEGIGSEQSGLRPVLVIQNDIGNKFSPTIIVAAITSQDKAKMPTHVILGQDCGLDRAKSVVMLEQIRTIDRSRIKKHIGHVNEDDVRRINKAYEISGGTWTDEDALIENMDRVQNAEMSMLKKVFNVCLGLLKRRELVFNN